MVSTSLFSREVIGILKAVAQLEKGLKRVPFLLDINPNWCASGRAHHNFYRVLFCPNDPIMDTGLRPLRPGRIWVYRTKLDLLQKILLPPRRHLLISEACGRTAFKVFKKTTVETFKLTRRKSAKFTFSG